MHPFAEVIFKCNFLNANYSILVHILLKIVPNGSIENKSEFCIKKRLSADNAGQAKSKSKSKSKS